MWFYCHRRLRYFEPEHPFRTTFAYNNYLYVLAGHVAEVLEKDQWEAINKREIFEPLGMTSSRYAIDIHDGLDVAKPYATLSGQPVEVDIRSLQ